MFWKIKKFHYFNRIFKISNILAANLGQTFTDTMYTMCKLIKGLYCCNDHYHYKTSMKGVTKA